MSASDVLLGDFVNLRPLKVSDAEITLYWRQADRSKYLNAGATDLEAQKRWIRSRPRDEYNFIIELKSESPVGMISLTSIDFSNKNAEPGRFLIGDARAVRGVPAAVESMKLLYEFAFETLGLSRVHGIVAANNQLMIKWQKYLGMKEEGRLRSHLRQSGGKFEDAICLGMLVDEYRNTARPKMDALIASARKVNNGDRVKYDECK